MPFAALKIRSNPVVLQLCLSSSSGGLEAMPIRMAKLYRKEGYEAPVICLENSSIHISVINQKIPHLILDSKSLFIKKIYSTLKFIEQERVTHILAHHLHDLRLVWIIKKFLPKIHVIAWSHLLVDYKKFDPIHQSIYSIVDSLICMTDTHRFNLTQSLPISFDKIKVIPLGLDLTKFCNISAETKNEFRRLHNCNQTDFVLGCAGRFDPQKGQLELVTAVKNLKKRGYKFKLLLVGEDTYNEPGTKEKCRHLIEDYDLCDCVHIYDFIDDLNCFYHSIDMFVMPSHKETFGLVLIEAMASGCICLSTNAGGPIDILEHGTLGPLVDPCSPISICEGIQDVLINKQHWEMQARIGQEKALSTYGEKKLVSNLLQLVK